MGVWVCGIIRADMGSSCFRIFPLSWGYDSPSSPPSPIPPSYAGGPGLTRENLINVQCRLETNFSYVQRGRKRQRVLMLNSSVGLNKEIRCRNSAQRAHGKAFCHVKTERCRNVQVVMYFVHCPKRNFRR